MTPPFAELVSATNYSFLRGASRPADMVAQAINLGMAGIGIADRNSVAGVVRAHVALRDALEGFSEEQRAVFSFRLVVGARLCFADDTPDIIAYPTTRYGWGRLTRLLTLGNLRAVKGDCLLQLRDLLGHCQDMALIVMADVRETTHKAALSRISKTAPSRVWIGATMPRSGRDHRRLVQLANLASECGIPLLATNDALYAEPEDRPLHDVLTCIRAGNTIDEAGTILRPNAERHLKGPAEMARLFAQFPESIAASADILAQIQFTLDDLRYEYPHEAVPDGWEPQDWLEHLVIKAAQERWPDGIPAKAHALMDEEFTLIRKAGYAHYFLTVYDLVKFARSQTPPILCQGRGSENHLGRSGGAQSAVFALHIRGTPRTARY